MSTATQVATAIYTILAANGTVAGLVGSRIYPVRAPQGAAAPYVIFQQVGVDPDQSQEGPSEAAIRLYQFTCFAATYEGSLALRDAVSAALDGVDLSTGDNPTLDDERDGTFEEAVNLHRADCDFLI